MKKVMIDMDDVICDGGFLYLVNQFLGTNYQIEDIKNYYIQDLIPQRQRQDFCKFFLSKNMYDYTQFVPEAYQTLRELNKQYDIYITTAYLIRDDKTLGGEHLKNKFNWLYQNLPFIEPEKYIFTSNKELISCEVKIDDKPSNLIGDAEQKLLFTAYHNKEITEQELEQEGLIRVNGWQDVEKILL